jgi:hypothetical protein
MHPVRADLTPAPGGFRFTVAYGALRPGLWDLRLRPGGETVDNDLSVTVAAVR